MSRGKRGADGQTQFWFSELLIVPFFETSTRKDGSSQVLLGSAAILIGGTDPSCKNGRDVLFSFIF